MLVGISNASQEEGWESYSGRVCKIVLHLRELGWGLFCLMNLVENAVAVGHAAAHHLGLLCVQRSLTSSLLFMQSLQKLGITGCGFYILFSY